MKNSIAKAVPILWLPAFFLLAFRPGGAEAKLTISGSAMVSAQDVDFDTTAGALDEDFNFNDPRVNLYLKSEISENIAFQMTIWAANDWSHEIIRGNGGTIALNDAAELRATFVQIKNVFGSGMTAKLGKIAVPFGHESPNRTGNGDSSKNDFLRNSLLDVTNALDDGVHLSGSFENAGLTTPLSWELAVVNGGAVTDGSPSGGGGQNRSNDDLAFGCRLVAALADNLTAEASYYTNDQRTDGDNDPLHIGSSLFVQAVESGDHTAAGTAGTNKNLSGLVYNDDGQGGGYDRDLWEVAAKYQFEGGYLMGFWGNIDADTVSAGNSREWSYWGVQGRYNLSEDAYVAARWNVLDPDYAGSAAIGEPTLWAVAGGYKVADNTMVKAEWTSFDEDGDGLSNQGTAIGAASAPDGQRADAQAITIALGVKF